MAAYQSFAQRLIQGEQEANGLQGDNANASSKVIKGISTIFYSPVKGQLHCHVLSSLHGLPWSATDDA